MIADLPPCTAGPALLGPVFTNLPSNACTSSRPRERARVEIGCIARDGETVYHGKDPRVEVGMRYAEKLLQVFERLCSGDAFEGTGVGVATAQGTSNRHGGRLWADAAPGEGATFPFTVGRGGGR